jgi:hypothetical protein
MLQAVIGQHVGFDLPVHPRWLIRAATSPQYRSAPYLSLALGKGVVHMGQWMAILSRNGVQDHELQEHLQTLPSVLAELEARACSILAGFRPRNDTPPGVQLLYVEKEGDTGIMTIERMSFANARQAQSAQLLPGAQPVAIAVGATSILYSPHFGWHELHVHAPGSAGDGNTGA